MIYEEVAKETVNKFHCNDCVSLKCTVGCIWFIIKNALDKQMPKKPDAYYDGYYDGYPVWEYKCPCCGRDIDDTDHHCVCGQTIDWSEE